MGLRFRSLFRRTISVEGSPADSEKPASQFGNISEKERRQPEPDGHVPDCRSLGVSATK